MPRRKNPVPTVTRHAARNLVRVRLDGRDRYFGPWDIPESHEKANRFIAEYISGGAVEAAEKASKAPRGISVTELILAYLAFAEKYYVKNGRPTNEVGVIKDTLKVLRQHYGQTPANEFGPLRLEAVREAMVAKEWARTSINNRVHRIRRMFAWGVAKQLVRPDVLVALKAVPGLRRGRTTAKESQPVKPVAAETVNATLPHLTGVVRGMVLFQAATGARPAEVCILRPSDIERDGDVWIYRPATHKTEHHGIERVIFIGPKGQRAIAPFLDHRPESAFVFSPVESEVERHAAMRERRKTKVQPSQRDRRKPQPQWTAGESFTPASYRRAIAYAVKRANKPIIEENNQRAEAVPKLDPLPLIPSWSPNMLRHAAATAIRKEFGLEAAQVSLGHAQADVTQVYAERDMELARRVATAIG